MNMFRKVAAIGVLSIILTIMAAFALLTEPPAAKTAGDEEAVSVTAVGGVSEKPDKKYTLKNVSGFIGIFETGNTETPATVTGIIVGKLRAADAELIEKGIEVTGEEELTRLLEDLGS